MIEPPSRQHLLTFLLSLVVIYGALLRFEAFHQTYGPLGDGEQSVRVQNGVASLASHLHPATITFTRGLYPYRFDPKSYLDSAREMKGFYEGRLREPAFVLLTKSALWLTGGQDIAVSAVSALASTLLVPATFVLGCLLGGPVIGLLAALIVALDPDLISWSAKGYRDDFFALVTVLFTCACVLWIGRPSRWRAGLVGIAGAVACLTRITALSFVAPALVFLLFSQGRKEWRRMLPLVGIAAALTIGLLAPYLIGCWIRYGDPFYAINWHTGFYLRREFGDRRGGTGIGSYLTVRLGSDMLRSTDTLIRGMTTYPLANKWHGVADHWSSWLAWGLRVLCIPGLLVWLWSPKGRVTLVVLGGSLLPFAVTWEVYSDWRFTLHAIPFLAVAAVAACINAFEGLAALRSGKTMTNARACGGRVLLSAALVAVIVAVTYVLPLAIFASDLGQGQPAGIGAGPRDFLFFGRSWFPPKKEGNVTYRYAKGNHGSVRVPLTRAGAYTCLLRMDPTPATAAQLALDVTVNGRHVRRFVLE